MARIELLAEVIDDFDRSFRHLADDNVDDAPVHICQIVDAFQILTMSPLIGRPAPDGTRELIIGTDSRGYDALYRFEPGIDVVFVLAVRNQREAGYKRNR